MSTGRAPSALTDLLLRAAALGAAAGARTSLGVAGPVLSRPLGEHRTADVAGRVATSAGVVVEMTNDKLPFTPSRLRPPGPYLRLGVGALGALLLARRADLGTRPTLAAVAAGVTGAAAGTWGGAAWRRLGVGRWPDWPAGLAEDLWAGGLTVYACRPAGAPPGPG